MNRLNSLFILAFTAKININFSYILAFTFVVLRQIPTPSRQYVGGLVIIMLEFSFVK